jgi:hypothetical protein
MHRPTRPAFECWMSQELSVRWLTLGQYSAELFFERRKTMRTYLQNLLLMTAAIALSGSSLAMADDYRDHNYKGWNSLYLSSRSHSTSRSFQSNAPMSAQSETAPSEVAEAPTHDRTYSYEPAQQGDSSSGAKNGDSGQSTATDRPAQTRRSFSYEPSESSPTVGRAHSTSRRQTSYARAMHAKGY